MLLKPNFRANYYNFDILFNGFLHFVYDSISKTLFVYNTILRLPVLVDRVRFRRNLITCVRKEVKIMRVGVWHLTILRANFSRRRKREKVSENSVTNAT